MADRRYTINAFTVTLEPAPDQAADPSGASDLHVAANADVERSVAGLLEVMESFDVRATFFTADDISRHLPGTVRMIHEAGHELAILSRRFHKPLDQLLRFRAEISSAKARLEDISGQEIVGYRSTPISSGWRSPAMVETLVQEGFIYSSSTYPKRSIAPAIVSSTITAHRLQTDSGTLWELPLVCWRPFGLGIPSVRTAGGTRLTALPSWMFARGVEGMNRHGEPAILYVHSWALDSVAHDYSSLPFRERLLTYGPRTETLARLEAIFRMHRFGSIHEAYASRLTTDSNRPAHTRRTSIVRLDPA